MLFATSVWYERCLTVDTTLDCDISWWRQSVVACACLSGFVLAFFSRGGGKKGADGRDRGELGKELLGWGVAKWYQSKVKGHVTQQSGALMWTSNQNQPGTTWGEEWSATALLRKSHMFQKKKMEKKEKKTVQLIIFFYEVGSLMIGWRCCRYWTGVRWDLKVNLRAVSRQT